MNGPDRQIHLSFPVHLAGSHPAGWLHPATEDGSEVIIRSYRRMAKLAGHGLFDLF